MPRTDTKLIRNGPIQSIGIGLRSQHYQDILKNRPTVPWFEALTDNYLGDGGQPLAYLEQIRAEYPITLHGVGMSLGSFEPLNFDYLKKVKNLNDRMQPAWLSDHLCWSASGGHYSHDLLPLPYTEEAIKHMSTRIAQAQDFLGQQLVIENVSSYVSFAASEVTEWEFLIAVVDQADCMLLLDINNIYVSARNHNFNPETYLSAIPAKRVREIHLAGYEDQGTHLLDTHGEPVHQHVWTLYEKALGQLGPIPTLIEWDTNIPTFQQLLEEARKAEQIFSSPGRQDAA